MLTVSMAVLTGGSAVTERKWSGLL